MNEPMDPTPDAAATCIAVALCTSGRVERLAAGFRRVETKPIEAQRLLAAVKAELARGPSP